MKFTPYPLLFRPVYKDYLWGGDRIRTVFQRHDTPEVCAESWEISAHPDGPGIVANGALAGRSLSSLAAEHGVALTGSRAPAPHSFPLLFKIIDARERLSVQVHPGGTPCLCGGDPKTEMWHVLDALPGAVLFAGLRPGSNAMKLQRALAADRVAASLYELPARAGDTLYIPGGLVHAIGAGCLIYEVQQNSNTTFRLYDWGRVDKNGQPRQLNIECALQAINWQLPAPELTRGVAVPRPGAANHLTELLTTPFFHMQRLTLGAPETLAGAGTTFQAIFVRSGAISATCGGLTVALPAGTSCLIPAAATSCHLEPLAEAEILITTLAP